MSTPTWHHGVTARWWALFNTSGPEIDYFRRYVEAGQPALDLACGTGRLLLPYLRDGLGTTGPTDPALADDFVALVAERTSLDAPRAASVARTVFRVIDLETTGNSFTARSTRTAPRTVSRSNGGSRTICGRKKKFCRGCRLPAPGANSATGCPSSWPTGFRTISYATSNAYM